MCKLVDTMNQRIYQSIIKEYPNKPCTLKYKKKQ